MVLSFSKLVKKKMSSANGVLHRKLILYVASLWFSLSALFLGFFRVKLNEDDQTKNSNCSELNSNGAEVYSDCLEGEEDAKGPEIGLSEFNCTKEDNVLIEEETPKFVFKFEYQISKDNYEPIVSHFVSSSTISKREEDSNLSMDEGFSFRVKELYELEVEKVEEKAIAANSDNNNVWVDQQISDSVFSSTTEKCKEEDSNLSEDEGFIFKLYAFEAEEVEEKPESEIAVDSENNYVWIDEQILGKNVQCLSDDSSIGKNEIFVEEKIEAEHVLDEGKAEFGEEKLERSISGKAIAAENNVWIDEQQFWGKMDLITTDSDSDSDSDSIASSHELFSRAVASSRDSFLSENDFEEAFKFINLRNSEDLEYEDMNSQNWMSSGYEADDIDDETDSDILEELDNLDESLNMQNSSNENPENSAEKEHHDDDDGEDSNGLETLWEHQELIEQLKMELKKVRATGLPTILEDDESPKIMEDLKPWKIDDKFQHEDRIGELHKFYRSYRERMRKFDIFNYQKMYAIGLLQSKDPLKSINWSNKASSGPALTSLFSIGKQKECSNDPTENFIAELHSDLELVYVAQMCLSWEILHWQYRKALEIWDSDPYGIRRFNEVAGEFQQFQVVLQRFIENEPFEGPRIQYYVKNRCVNRKLLQVPVIREDNKDKKRRRHIRESDDNAIRSDTLVEIVEESIRIFWRFVRADKDTHNVIHKSRKRTQIQRQDPVEVELLIEVRTSLIKREKKLKEILRSGSCILRKFRKQKNESSSDQFLYFFSQVDMKLVSRVLNMSKVTVDQLLWCRSKLEKINFVSRKINVEPSFLLFPC